MSDLRFKNVRGEDAMNALGHACAGAWRDVGRAHGMFVHLSGNLGVGKTTLVRAWLQGLGHKGAVRSPTYTLIEPYQLADGPAFHLDLYRLGDPEELEFLGLRDLLAEPALVLVEWPERGHGVLPAAELSIVIDAHGDSRTLTFQAHAPIATAFNDTLRDISKAGI